MKKPIIALLIAFCLSSTLSADVYIKTVTRVDPIEAMGQSIPARESVSEQWISDDFYYLETGEGLPIFLIPGKTSST